MFEHLSFRDNCHKSSDQVDSFRKHAGHTTAFVKYAGQPGVFLPGPANPRGPMRVYLCQRGENQQFWAVTTSQISGEGDIFLRWCLRAATDSLRNHEKGRWKLLCAGFWAVSQVFETIPLNGLILAPNVILDR
jgi:hypothetical protein